MGQLRNNIEHEFRRALQSFQDGELKNAANILELIVAKDENNADAYHLLGVIEAICENPERGKSLVELSIQKNPHAADAHYHLGNILLLQLNDPEAAIQSFSRALLLSPKSLEARLNRGAAYSKLSMYEETLLDYQQILLIDPYSYDVLIRMGKIFLRCNRLEDALIKFRLAIEINVNAEEAYHGAAHVLSQQGFFEESNKLYTKALSLNPESDAILANFGGLQLKLGNFDSGLEKIRAAHGAIEFNLINGVSIKNGRH